MLDGHSPDLYEIPSTQDSFDVSISSEQLNQLKEEIPSDELEPNKQSRVRQELLDGIFTQERRERLLQTASEDSKGRKVRYFRKMSYSKMLELLESGEQSHLSYIQDIEAHFDDELEHLLFEYSLEDKGRKFVEGDSINENFKRVLGGVIPENELNDAARDRSLGKLIPLLGKYLPQDFMAAVHSGGMSQVFSPYISLSVGGIISIPQDRVYVEMIIPDSEIIPTESGNEGEKEVFTRKIKRSHISRVYVDRNTLFKDEVKNPDTIIGSYNKEHPAKFTDDIDNWKWNEKTVDCLPVSLLSQTIITQSKGTLQD